MYRDQSMYAECQRIVQATAKVLEIPEPLIAYVLFQKIFKDCPVKARLFVTGSSLHSLLQGTIGHYRFITIAGQVFIQRKKKLLLWRKGALSWKDVFEIADIKYTDEQIKHINNILERALIYVTLL